MERGAQKRSKWNPDRPVVRAWIANAIGPGARVLRVEPLPASDTSKHLVTVLRADGSTMELLLRRYDDTKRLSEDPWYVPEHEARALTVLAETDVPAARLYATDLKAKVCDVPAILESWLPGEPVLNPSDLSRYLAASAEVLVKIHSARIPESIRIPQYAPYSDPSAITPPPYSTQPQLWSNVALTLQTLPEKYQSTFIHRDYHPGNILWDGSRVTGVVDWVTAAFGPPGIDLARMRLSMASAYGRDVADRFVDAYVAAGGARSAHDPHWDLLDAADRIADLEPPVGDELDAFVRFEEYVEEVLDEVRNL